MKSKNLTLFSVVAVLMLAMIACSFGSSTGDDQSPTQNQSAVTSQEDNEAAPSANRSATGQQVTNLDNVISASILIEAEGTFLDPEYGSVSMAGRGSGFIIDPRGIAVTNNHVVTGAGLVKVWIGGEGEPLNAQVLGVSECSDLAVIDIEGEGYPYLGWYSGEIKRGLEIFAAGYPLGDPEFALTRGIVSKLEADGETAFASVDQVLMHDANINPGNSGGPLVDASGQVVAINYAFNPQADQYFAISRLEAMQLLQTLQSGQDVDAIGLNGTAFVSPTSGLTGIWISSVGSGSLADQAGIKAGDILTMMEGIILAQQGTMTEYCDILRTHDLADTVSIEVLRSSDGSYMTGQLNGRPLGTDVAFGGSQGDGPIGDPSTAGDSFDYTLVMDDMGAIQMEIPTSWTDVDGTVWWLLDRIPYASIYAAPNLQQFTETWEVPGVKFNVSDEIAELGGYIEQLDLFSTDYRELCEYDGRFDYQDQLYRGKYDWYYNCGGPGGASYMILSAVPIDNPTDFLILVEVQAVNEVDLEAMDRILGTFQVVGVLP